MGALQPIHLVILLVIVLVLFGGSRLAGLGKSSGRAIREFKEETKDLRSSSHTDASANTATTANTTANTAETPRVESGTSAAPSASSVSEPERVENPAERRDA